MNTNYLVLEIEEVFRQVHISKGKKCYAGLLATGNEFYNWKRDVKSE